ncbi:SunS family peptide S-glycosyltransferase [Bacillus thuringiensis]|uniref:SunS family peptide S-glycosyltransferase n=1 Tax=Bacillus thuringiensis TaxID=1428 RepID=UPI000D03AD76|nr:SunS family peptide S-glycosyltransferase [Bacillus thuringiensis]MDR5041910.1 SunS family peptide S-glycosyltransferase [Bacillus thuringiensis]
MITNLYDLFIKLNENYQESSLLKDLSLIKNIEKYKDIKIKHIKNLQTSVEKYETLNYPSITCGIITYNEERCIQRCLKSVINEFDNTIILDSVSTDNTINIIKDHFPSVKILSQTWKNDFSHHRNIIINHSNDDWIYFIDADNIYNKDNKGKAKKIAKMINFLQIRCVISPMIHEHNGHIYIDTRRLFSLKNNILFNGKVHEEPIFEDNTIPTNITVDIHIKHDGYNPEIINQNKKNIRNINLTKQMIELEPNNPKWLFFYARELEQGNKDNHEIKNTLINAINAYDHYEDKRYYIDTLLLLCKILFKTAEFKELSHYITILEKEFPNCIDSSYYKANLLLLNTQMKLRQIINYLETDLYNNKYSIINTTNDHVQYTILKLNYLLEDLENMKNSYNILKSNEMKQEFIKYVKNLQQIPTL